MEADAVGSGMKRTFAPFFNERLSEPQEEAVDLIQQGFQKRALPQNQTQDDVCVKDAACGGKGPLKGAQHRDLSFAVRV